MYSTQFYARFFGTAALAAFCTLGLMAAGCSSPGGDTLGIQTVTPNSGTPFGGTAIKIAGSDFEATDTVDIGSVPCANLKFVSAEEIDCVTPPAVAGAVDVSLIREGVVATALPGGFTYGCMSPAPVGTSIWANEGGDKVPQDDLRAVCSPSEVINRTWDGTNIKVFGARNEVVNFNLVIEAPTTGLSGVSVAFDTLTGPGGFKIASQPATGDGVFNWTNRNIELFYIRYLKVLGLSHIAYEFYDERQIPKRLERPWTGPGDATPGTRWTDRPDHDKYYPDIAVPLEVVGNFDVAGAKSQSIWADIYIPKTAPVGAYTGTVKVTVGGKTLQSVPVQLTVRNMPPLPDTPTSKTMVELGYSDLGKRYFGQPDLTQDQADGPKLDKIRDRAFMMAHRHKISLVDQNLSYTKLAQPLDQPQAVWLPRLNGSLFTAVNGYDGPGVSTSNGIFAIGIYNTWSWVSGTENDMWAHTNAWQSWFDQNAPTVEHPLFLEDEVAEFAQDNTWNSWLKDPANTSGDGAKIPSMIGDNILAALQGNAGVDIIASLIAVGDSTAWPAAISQLKNGNPNAKFFLYNGKRPASGSFATEDDGVALRELAWGQYKKQIDRWFYWESTYYNNYQGVQATTPAGQVPEWDTSLFQAAQTFGSPPVADPVLGQVPRVTTVTKTDGTQVQVSEPYGNGDGVLFYPGTDTVFPDDSYGLNGPIASLRLKHWRRGIQDVDYIAMASAISPAVKAQVDQIVAQMVPSVLWEPGLTNPSDPSSSRVAPSWSINPDDWEAARDAIATIIENAQPAGN